MSLEVTFLGTAGSIPTRERALPAIAVRREGTLILFDCGEGVQRQMIKARLGFNRKMKIFVTHLHGDHIFGLPGLIQTMSLLDRTKKLEIFGPRGLRDFLEAVEKTVISALSFPIDVVEIEREGVVCEEIEYDVQAVMANHVAPALAYGFVEKPRLGKFHPGKAKELGIPEGVLWSKLQHGENVTLSDGQVIEPEDVVGPMRPGRRIVYTGDSRSSESIVRLSKDADILIHECTFDDELVERALEDGHSTPSEAARAAKKAKVKTLVLTHISARYKNPDLLLEQALKIFPNVVIAEDFMRIKVPLRCFV